MKSQIRIILLLVGLFLSSYLYGEKATSYEMEIVQTSLQKFKVKLDISLQENYCKSDTVEFSFGGLIPILTVKNLKIKSQKSIRFIFDKKSKLIKIAKKDINQNKIYFEYNFNVIWGASRDKVATLFYNSSEYPIPFIENIDSIYFTCKIKKLKNFSVKTNIQKKGEYYISELTDINSIAFMFLDTIKFNTHSYSTTLCKINIFTTDNTLTENDFNRLGNKLTNCIDYFSENISPYRYNELNIAEVVWWGSTYLGSIAFINKPDFKSYTVFHEIVHEWLGGIIAIKKDSEGEFLLSESLNDYLTMQFLRYQDGDSLYNVAIKIYIDRYNDYLEKNHDTSIWNIEKYVNSTHPIIIYKQVILLDELAKKIGYDKFNSSIFKFLKSIIGKSVETLEFLDFLKNEYGQDAIDYCNKI